MYSCWLWIYHNSVFPCTNKFLAKQFMYFTATHTSICFSLSESRVYWFTTCLCHAYGHTIKFWTAQSYGKTLVASKYNFSKTSSSNQGCSCDASPIVPDFAAPHSPSSEFKMTSSIRHIFHIFFESHLIVNNALELITWKELPNHLSSQNSVLYQSQTTNVSPMHVNIVDFQQGFPACRAGCFSLQ